MRNFSTTMKSLSSPLGADLLQNKSIGLTVLFFHEAGYRVHHSNKSSALSVAQVYLADYKPLAYGLIFEGAYETPLEGAADCLMMVIVRADEHAFVEHIPVIKDAKGQRSMGEVRHLMVDEPYLHLFDALDKNAKGYAVFKDDAKKTYKTNLEPYRSFIVSMS